MGRVLGPDPQGGFLTPPSPVVLADVGPYSPPPYSRRLDKGAQSSLMEEDGGKAEESRLLDVMMTVLWVSADDDEIPVLRGNRRADRVSP